MSSSDSILIIFSHKHTGLRQYSMKTTNGQSMSLNHSCTQLSPKNEVSRSLKQAALFLKHRMIDQHTSLIGCNAVRCAEPIHSTTSNDSEIDKRFTSRHLQCAPIHQEYWQRGATKDNFSLKQVPDISPPPLIAPRSLVVYFRVSGYWS